MSKPSVRCRCGHAVLAKEVLRTDLYERPSGKNYVYIKFRCRRCKRLGQAFIAETSWDWSVFEPARDEMSDSERELFASQSPVSVSELLDFHCSLEATDSIALAGWELTPPQPVGPDESPIRREIGGDVTGSKARESKPKETKGEITPFGPPRARNDDSPFSSNSKSPTKNTGDDNAPAEDLPQSPPTQLPPK
jgi:hypothetical protein